MKPWTLTNWFSACSFITCWSSIPNNKYGASRAAPTNSEDLVMLPGIFVFFQEVECLHVKRDGLRFAPGTVCNQLCHVVSGQDDDRADMCKVAWRLLEVPPARAEPTRSSQLATGGRTIVGPRAAQWST